MLPGSTFWRRCLSRSHRKFSTSTLKHTPRISNEFWLYTSRISSSSPHDGRAGGGEKQESVSKENFLVIYGTAHIRALTKSTIKSAFSKTGVWPFSRHVVTVEMMAPSLETATRGHLPVPPTTPVRVITDMLYQARQRVKTARLGSDSASDAGEKADNSLESPTPRVDHPSPPRRRRLPDPFATPVRDVIVSLRTTSAAFLITSSPVQSASEPPHIPATIISRQKAPNMLLASETTAALEHELMVALKAENAKNKVQKLQMIAMQSALVLKGVYCDLVRGQFGVNWRPKRNAKTATRRGVSSGMAYPACSHLAHSCAGSSNLRRLPRQRRQH
ncbi:hypothetical protein B0H10DRAFT_47299 [Mycena sp. CBHHK59/15]|nr:hypothetical protein B0H10DRAFT_47299 [Mycena sp. CBHHK59/15]